MWTSERLLNLLRRAVENDEIFNLNAAEQLLQIGRVVEMPPKTHLQKRNHRVTSLFVPLNAPMFAFIDVEDYARPAQILEIGQIVGLAHAITFSPYPHDIKTKTSTELLTIPSNHIRSLIDLDVNMRWQVLTFLAFFSKDTRVLSAVIDADPAQRLCSLLIDLTKTYGSRDAGVIWINYKLSQDEIGERIGTSRQTVNKYILQFVEKGWLTRKGHQYGILNLDALSAFHRAS